MVVTIIEVYFVFVLIGSYINLDEKTIQQIKKVTIFVAVEKFNNSLKLRG